MKKYRVWLQQTDLVPVEIQAEDLEEVRMKIEQILYERMLYEETSVVE